MKLTERQQAILIGVLRDATRLAAMTPQYEHGNRALVMEREDIANAHQWRVRCNPGRWLRCSMTPSLSTMVSRTYSQLEAKGLVERCALGYVSTFTTHIGLTPAGIDEAKHLIAAEATDG
jgi:hypothetical protein